VPESIKFTAGCHTEFRMFSVECHNPNCLLLAVRVQNVYC